MPLDELPGTVYRRALHIVREQARVRECVEKLAHGDLRAVGKLLLASHESSSKLFENSTEKLDTLVKLLTKEDAVYGARLTGGGFGGAVMALCRSDFSEEDARRVAEGFAKVYEIRPCFRGMEIADGARRLEFLNLLPNRRD